MQTRADMWGGALRWWRLRRWFGLCRPKNGERFWLHKNEPVASGRYVRCVRCKKRRNDWIDPEPHSAMDWTLRSTQRADRKHG